MLFGDFTVSEGHGHPLVMYNDSIRRILSYKSGVCLKVVCEERGVKKKKKKRNSKLLATSYKKA
jgi:hypothetical protein